MIQSYRLISPVSKSRFSSELHQRTVHVQMRVLDLALDLHVQVLIAFRHWKPGTVTGCETCKNYTFK